MMVLHGRRMIKTMEKEVTAKNIVAVLNKALLVHQKNRTEIKYLWNFNHGSGILYS